MKVSLKRIALALGLVTALTGAVVVTVGSRREAEVNQMMLSPEWSAGVIVPAVRAWQAYKQGCPTVRELEEDKQLDPSRVTDPWGSAYLIECNERTITIHSLGADRQLNTRDDVVVSKRE